MATGEAGFGLYVHWPFCRRKCPYCDFNSHVAPSIDQDLWRRSLLAELSHMAERTPHRRLTSIFFGGGTPSLMPPDTVAAIIEASRRCWAAAPDLEITLEANPTSSEAARFAAFADAGVNRISIGVQALDDAALRWLGREHDSAAALHAVALAKAAVDRVSFDLIYARPDQTREAWRRELCQALDLGPSHLSLYQLTIEPTTPFFHMAKRGEFMPMEDDPAADLYEDTQALTGEAGLAAYEVSNHAREGQACRHNLTYWRGGEWAGIGPGAHGRLSLPDGRHATAQARAPEAWLRLVAAQGHGTQHDRLLPPREAAEEVVMTALRLVAGLGEEDVRRVAGLSLSNLLEPRHLDRLVREGLVDRQAGRLVLTTEGRLRLNAVTGYLLG